MDAAAAAAAAKRADEVRALREERAGYIARGLKDRAAAVDAELARLAPKKRAAPKKDTTA
jgi:hypothetical protein